MQKFQQQFIDFCQHYDVLTFGEYTLKSGRISPYFFNFGQFNSGQALAYLGRSYGETIFDSGIEYDMLFGPAYKGIPLVSTVASYLYTARHQDHPYAFNRKEAKTHGEGGQIVGAPLTGKVLIVDDVISAGTACREAAELVQQAGAEVAGIVVSLDRQERGQGDLSAIDELASSLGIPVLSVIKLEHIIAAMTERDPRIAESMLAYRHQYGA